ncbi:hypothetical protein [Tepidiphilus succinatimandens]|uniref:hypothetical protein n=1 Tax=Tepidiphilus succinatimandens TaxID=224436 RepID=UPI0014769175|nr:hypothetical protein [Tepidiphilus succinatimandens]
MPYSSAGTGNASWPCTCCAASRKVEPRFGMADTVRSVALREYRRQMERALREELAKG